MARLVPMGPNTRVDYNLTLQYVHSRVESSTFTMGLGNPVCQSRPQPYARVDFIPHSGTLDLASGLQSKLRKKVIATVK
jgi:hypothetical protein